MSWCDDARLGRVPWRRSEAGKDLCAMEYYAAPPLVLENKKARQWTDQL